MPDYSDCYDRGCLADGEWATTPIETTLRRPCGPGYTGYLYRTCNAQGVWSSVDDSECEQLVCPAMGGLPETPAGTTLEVPCGEHYEGMMTGTCSIYGVWTSVDVSQCGRGERER